MITREKIDQALEIIREEIGDAGVDDCDREHSLKPYFVDDKFFPKEYRLSNPALGFGGKLRLASPNGNLRISAYPEDMKGSVPETIERLNKRLANLTTKDKVPENIDHISKRLANLE